MFTRDWLQTANLEVVQELLSRAAARRRGRGADGAHLVRPAPCTVECLEQRALLSVPPAAFLPQQTFAVGNNPHTVAVADLNHDGKLDLVVSSGGGNNIGVLLGNGDGTFQPQMTFSAGAASIPRSATIADLNLDGKPDIVVANSGTGQNSVSVLLGNGNGTFQSPLTFAAGTAPFSVAVADVDLNGKPDLIVANSSSDSVSVLLGNGNGTFEDQQTFATGSFPRFVLAADFNGDGIPDLATANDNSDNVSVLLGNRDGTFKPQVTYAAPNAFRMAAADINGDGNTDLVVASYYSACVSVLVGNGNGTFGAPMTFATGAGSRPTAVAVADVNGDGRPDIIAADYTSDNMSVLLGNGDSTFQPQQTFSTGAGSHPCFVAVADVNGDGKPDALVSNYQGNTVGVFLGSGGNFNASFQSQQTFSTGGNSNPRAVAVADGDGKPDFVTANYQNSTVGVQFGDGAGTFGPPQTFSTGDNPNSVAVADVNKDGRLDLVVANDGSGTVSVLLGNGDGTFQPQMTFSTGAGALTYSVAVADVNGDGSLDLIVANRGTKNVGVLLGNGDGTFQAQQTFAIGFTPFAVVVADLNGDGKPDIAVADSVGNDAGVLLGNGDGTFAPEQTYATGLDPRSLAVSDVNGDGTLDLIVANAGSNSVSVLLGNGDGTFQSQQTVTVGGSPRSVVVADLNSDGKPDLVVANFNDSTVGTLLGDGNGDFQAQKTYATGTHPFCTVVSDVNDDGRPDLLVANLDSNTVSVLMNNGTIGAATVTASITASDLITAGESVESVSVTYTSTDAVAIDTSTIDANDISVAAPGGTLLAVSGQPSIVQNGNSVTANYTVAAPNGQWRSTDNGTYVVSVAAGGVTDVDGDRVVAASGSFAVAVPQVDLTLRGVVTKLHARIVSLVSHMGMTSVSISNNSITTVAGKFAIVLYASPTPGVDGSPATLATVQKQLRLRPGMTHIIQFGHFAFPAAGQFYLVARVMLNGVVVSDAGVSASTINVSRGYFDIDAEKLAVLDAPVIFHNRIPQPRSLAADLTLQNLGNIAAKGTVNVVFTIMPGDGSSPTIFATGTIALNLGPGKKKIYMPRLPKFQPAYPVNTSLVAVVTLVGDDVTTNNTASTKIA